VPVFADVYTLLYRGNRSKQQRSCVEQLFVATSRQTDVSELKPHNPGRHQRKLSGSEGQKSYEAHEGRLCPCTIVYDVAQRPDCIFVCLVLQK
jgi:hypothetical protein